MKKGILTLFMCLLSFFSWVQEPQIIGGYLLDGEDSFEELDAAVVTDAKRKDKNLDGEGMRFPGRAMMIPRNGLGGDQVLLFEIINGDIVLFRRTYVLYMKI